MNRFFVPFSMAIAFLAGSFVAPLAPATANDTPCAEAHGVVVCRRDDGYVEYTLSDGFRLLTHGPDGPDPFGAHADGPPDDDGPGVRAERAPACGTTYVQHVLYGRPTGAPNRYTTVKGSIQFQMRVMNAQLDTDSLASGGVHSDYRVLCDATGLIRVDAFTASSTDYGVIVNGARSAGFDDPTRDYTIFWDGSEPGICGQANLVKNSSPGLNNPNNDGGGYAVVYGGCWTASVAMHENGHNQGAVQDLAPDWDGSGHCVEGRDVMCYPTSSFLVFCPSRLFFDCDYDTYYDAAPEPGEWLSTHWNIGDRANRFILYGGVRVPDAPLLGGFAGDAQVSLSWTAPADNGAFITAYKVFRNGALRATLGATATSFAESGLTNGVTLTYAVKATNAKGDSVASNALPLTPRSGNVPPVACFADSLQWLTLDVSATCASDADGTLVSYSWDWGDGSPAASGATASHLFDEPGSYVVALTVTDDNGATHTATKTIVASLPPDPDPAVPNLVNGVAASGTLPSLGSESFFKIFVPSGLPYLRVRLDGPNCLSAMAITVVCNPNLDLYVRQGARPTDGAYACRSMEIDSDEVCMPLSPAGDWWFVRVKYAYGVGAAPFSVTATY